MRNSFKGIVEDKKAKFHDGYLKARAMTPIVPRSACMSVLDDHTITAITVVSRPQSMNHHHIGRNRIFCASVMLSSL
jgi:hypothetical protein